MFGGLRRLIVILIAVCSILVTSQLNTNKVSKHIEEKINKLDHLTKQQILMMTHTGVPKDVIAKKISHVVGNSATAGRVIDGVNARALKEKQDIRNRQSNAAKNKKR